MTAAHPDDPSPQKYRVKRVEKAETPEGMPAGNWYRYVIGEGRSQIVGLKPGSLSDVTQHAETVAEELNNRATSGISVYSSRKRK